MINRCFQTGNKLCVLRRNQIFKDILFELAAQGRGLSERDAEGKILKADSVHIMKVYVCHSREGKPYPGRKGEGHSWI